MRAMVRHAAAFDGDFDAIVLPAIVIIGTNLSSRL